MEKNTSTRLSQDAEVGVKCSSMRVLSQPAANDRVRVGGVVVADQVQATTRVGAGDLLEERQELLVAMVGARTGW